MSVNSDMREGGCFHVFRHEMFVFFCFVFVTAQVLSSLSLVFFARVFLAAHQTQQKRSDPTCCVSSLILFFFLGPVMPDVFSVLLLLACGYRTTTCARTRFFFLRRPFSLCSFGHQQCEFSPQTCRVPRSGPDPSRNVQCPWCSWCTMFVALSSPSHIRRRLCQRLHVIAWTTMTSNGRTMTSNGRPQVVAVRRASGPLVRSSWLSLTSRGARRLRQRV